MPFNLGLARLLFLLLLPSLVVSQCPTTTEGVSPQVLSACSVLASSISAEIAAGATSVGGVITFAVSPTGSLGDVTATTTSVVSSSSLKRSSGTSTSSRTSATAGTMSTLSTSSPASSSAGVAASTTGSTGASASNSNNHHYRDTVIIPAAVVGSVVGAILIALLLWFCLRRRRKQSKDASDSGGSGAALNASPEVNDEKGYVVGAGPNGVNSGSYAPALGAAGATAGLAVGVYGSSSNREAESGSPMIPNMTAGSAGPIVNKEMGMGGESYGPAAAAVGAGSGLGAAGYGAARENQSSTGSTAVPYMSAGLGAGNNNGATSPASGNRSGATSPSSGRYPTSSPRLSGDQTAPWAAQPLRHFRRASRGELTAQDGPGPTADSAGAAALSSSQPVVASQEPEAEYLTVPGRGNNTTASGEDSPGLDDIEEASVEDTASYYTEARQSQGDLIGAARSGSDSRLYSTDTSDPAHAHGTWLESPRTSDLAKSYGAYQQPLQYSDESRTPTQTMPGSFYDPYSTEETPTPPQQQPSDPLQARYLQQQTQPGNRPYSTASSGLWSGLTEESDNWWNSGVPAVGNSERGSNPQFSGSRASGEPTFVGTGEVGTGTGRVIEGPWRGPSTSITSQSAMDDMVRGTGGSGRGSGADTLDRGDGGSGRMSGDMQSAIGGAGTRLSIPRKPIGVSDKDVGIAR